MIVRINEQEVEAKEGETILTVLRRNNIEVPSLCYHPDLEPLGKCRLCVVEVNGRLKTSCDNKVFEGMDIKTETDKVIKSRRLNVELLITNHNPQREDNELSRIAIKLGVEKSRFEKIKNKTIDNTSPAIYRDNNKCVLCGRCIQKCQDVQTVHAIGYGHRGHQTEITPYYFHGLGEVACVQCGQCTNVCPTGALKEQDYTQEVWNAINNPEKIVIVQTAPSIRATLGETLGLPPGTLVTGKMVAALRRIGFDKVLDTNFAADLTIVEESNELINRIKNNGVLPMITSCSPGWIKFIEHFFPKLLPHLSTCKSPQQMFGALLKTYYAEKNNLDPSKIVSVAVMPCTAKKYESQRPEMNSSGYQDVDIVITTRELGQMIKQKSINFQELPDEWYDPLMGSSSGAGAIFGATGGVMEAALRTAADKLEGRELEKLEYDEVRGLTGIRESELEIAGIKLRVAVAHGLGNARRLMELVEKNPDKYHFIEIMACEGGCIGGGGQPVPTTKELVKKRAQAIYEQDRKLSLRKSHKNPEIIQAYDEFLETPGSEKAHKYLHTKYVERTKFY